MSKFESSGHFLPLNNYSFAQEADRNTGAEIIAEAKAAGIEL